MLVVLGDELRHGRGRAVPPQGHVLEVRVGRGEGEPAARVGGSRGGRVVFTGRGHF